MSTCPLRYVLLLLSMIIALMGLSQAMQEEDEPSSQVEKKEKGVLETASRVLTRVMSGEIIHEFLPQIKSN